MYARARFYIYIFRTVFRVTKQLSVILINEADIPWPTTTQHNLQLFVVTLKQKERARLISEKVPMIPSLSLLRERNGLYSLPALVYAL